MEQHPFQPPAHPLGNSSPHDDGNRDTVEQIAEDFLDRKRRGEQPTMEEYVVAYPDHADEIRALLPTVVALENLKLRKEALSDRGASLGPAKLERLGDFRILGEIGRGGMGIVYEAKQESLGRHVALKVLPKQTLLDGKRLQRFQREAKTAANLHHTNIVPILGVGEHDGYHYFVMQYIRGVGLDQVIAHLRSTTNSTALTNPEASGEAPLHTSVTRMAECLLQNNFGDIAPNLVDLALDDSTLPGRALPQIAHTDQSFPPVVVEDGGAASFFDKKHATPESKVSVQARTCSLNLHYWKSVAKIGAQIADALSYAHLHGTLHRDIKPANLLLDHAGVTWVTDFGLAKAMEQENISRTGDVVGTLQYMAPEQFRGQADERSDVYSLGLTLYELMTLNPAKTDSLQTHVSSVPDVVPPRRLHPTVPRDLETIVLKALAHEPEHRYQSAPTLLADLQSFVEDRPIAARRVTAAERLWRWCRRNRPLAALSATAIASLLLLAITSTVGYFRVDAALKSEKTQRSKAEEVSDIAWNALDETFQRLSPRRITGISAVILESEDGEQIDIPYQPSVSPQTAALLETLVLAYQDLADQGAADASAAEQLVSQQKIAVAHRRVGDMRQRLGQYQEGIAAYTSALTLLKESVATPLSNWRIETEIASVHTDLANAHRSLQNFTASQEHHEQALSFLEKAVSAAHPGAETRYQLALALYCGATRSRGLQHRLLHRADSHAEHRTQIPDERKRRPPRGEFHPHRATQGSSARADLKRATELLETITQQDPEIPEYRHLLAIAYRDQVGPPHLNPTEEAEAELLRCRGILEDLVAEFPQVPDFQYELAETLARVQVRGRHLSAWQLETAEQQLQEAITISQTLIAAHPNVPEYLASQGRILARLATVERELGDLTTAKFHFSETLKVMEPLLSAHPGNLAYRETLTIAQDHLVHIYESEREFAAAEILLLDNIAALKDALASFPHIDLLHDRLRHRFTMLAHIYARQGDEVAATAAEVQADHHRDQWNRREHVPPRHSTFPPDVPDRTAPPSSRPTVRGPTDPEHEHRVLKQAPHSQPPGAPKTP